MRLVNWHRNALLTFGSTLLVFAVAEVLARALWDPGGYRPIVQADPVYGWKLAPNTSVRSVDTDRRLRYDVAVNSWGWRDPERPRAKRPGTKRVLFLGDSIVFGTGVQMGERTGDSLDRALGDGVEFVNAAVAGWGTDQQYLYLVREGFAVDPDVVVLGLCMANDVTNNMLGHNLFGTAPKPRFELHEGELVYRAPGLRPPAPRSRAVGRFLQHSRFLHYVGRHVRILRARARSSPPPEPGLPYYPEDLANDESNWSIYRVEYSEQLEKAFKVTEALIRAMHDSCAARDIPFVLFAFPQKVEVDGAARQREMAHFGYAPEWFDFQQPYVRVRNLAETLGCRYVYPLQTFREHGDSAQLFLQRDSHPSPTGHALAAQSLLPTAQEALRLPIQRTQR